MTVMSAASPHRLFLRSSRAPRRAMQHMLSLNCQRGYSHKQRLSMRNFLGQQGRQTEAECLFIFCYNFVK